MPQDTPWFKDVITLEIPSVWSDELLESLQTTVLPDYLPLCRWFGQKQRTLTSIAILETRAEQRSDEMRVMLLKLSFTEGHPVTQVLPLFIGKEDEGDSKGVPAVVARFSDGMVLWDALYVATCRKTVWEVLACREAIELNVKPRVAVSTELRMIFPEKLAQPKHGCLEGNNPIRHSPLTMLTC